MDRSGLGGGGGGGGVLGQSPGGAGMGPVGGCGLERSYVGRVFLCFYFVSPILVVIVTSLVMMFT